MSPCSRMAAYKCVWGQRAACKLPQVCAGDLVLSPQLPSSFSECWPCPAHICFTWSWLSAGPGQRGIPLPGDAARGGQRHAREHRLPHGLCPRGGGCRLPQVCCPPITSPSLQSVSLCRIVSWTCRGRPWRCEVCMGARCRWPQAAGRLRALVLITGLDVVGGARCWDGSRAAPKCAPACASCPPGSESTHRVQVLGDDRALQLHHAQELPGADRAVQEPAGAQA